MGALTCVLGADAPPGWPLTIAGNRAIGDSAPMPSYAGPLILFSKLLPGLAPRDLAREVKSLGFAGIDLTVRPKGHVEPARAAADLPAAHHAITAEGLSVPMITTALVSASDPTARPILETAARLKVPYFKTGYWRYQFADVRAELAKAGSELRGLAELARASGIQLGFHNHSGSYIGAPVWDAASILEPLDPAWAGHYFDIHHAVVEGGAEGWRIATQFVAPRLKMIAVKDFYWERGKNGKWGVHDCPLGEGMVNWPAYASLLARAGFKGPVSVHIEYDIEGATEAIKQERALAAAARDLAFIRARLDEAYASR